MRKVMEKQRLQKVRKKVEGRTLYRHSGRRKIAPLIAPARFSECYSWPSKIAYALRRIKRGTAEEIATEIMELESTGSQEGLRELINTVTEFVEKLRKIGKINGFGDGAVTSYRLIGR